MKPPAGGITAREPMVTTRPRPAAVIRGTAARAAVKVAVRLSVSMRSHMARSVSRRPPPAKPPTSVTRTSSRRWRAWSVLTRSPTARSSVTSARTRSSRSFAVASTPAWSRSRSASTMNGAATVAPSASRRRVTAWPSAPVPPVTSATRPVSVIGSKPRQAAWTVGGLIWMLSGRAPLPDRPYCLRESFGRWNRHDGRALDVLVPHLADVEVGHALPQLLERLLEGRQRLALSRKWRGAREDEVLHVGMVDPALLDPGHDDGQRLVGLSDEARALLALADAFLQRRLEELVDAPEDRREGASGEALVLLVEQAERDEVRRLELERPLFLGARRLTLGEAPVHADDLERLLLEVVGLLDVEREDLVAHVGLHDEDRRNVSGLELGQHGAAMIPVRRPVHAGLRRQRYHGIDEPVELLHALGQALDVRGREIALVGARLDLVAGQQAEDLPVVADGLLVEREHVPTVALHLLGELARRTRRLRLGIGHPARHAEPPLCGRRRRRAAQGQQGSHATVDPGRQEDDEDHEEQAVDRLRHADEPQPELHAQVLLSVMVSAVPTVGPSHEYMPPRT